MKSHVRRFIASLFEQQVHRLVIRHHLKVVAVGGSVGKTSTKTAIATVLSEKYRTLVHPGNYNSDLGLPLSVFELSVPGNLLNLFAWAWRLIQSEWQIYSYPYDVIVLELGTDHPGEIPLYLRYLSPDIGVLTALTPEHMENFPDGLDQVAVEELTLASASKIFLANLDEIPAKYRRKYIDAHPHHHYYGLDKTAEYGFEMISTDPQTGTSGQLIHAGHKVIEDLKIGLFGAHSMKAAVAAYAVGDLLGLSKHQIEAGLAKLQPVAGRMNPLAGLNGATIIDDTYNSSPDAAIAALASISDAAVSGRRIAILGSMNELGSDSPGYHEQVGEAAAGVDLLITIGAVATQHLGPAAVRAGLDPTRFMPAISPYAAGEHVKLLLSPGDIVLVKGSQNGVFAEEAVKILLADPSDAGKLVRQSPAWLHVKAKQFPDAP